jgi:hypothetical protein
MWQWFWWACFLLAGGSFTVIAGVVLVRGMKDLRDMIAVLDREKVAKQESQ